MNTSTLRILIILTAVAAAVTVAAIAFVATKPDPQLQAFLDRPNVIEQFKANAAPGSTDTEGQESPLVKQARKLALILNPPPPPVTQAPAPRNNTPVRDFGNIQKRAPEVQVPTTFSLVATAKYEDFPDKSMALIRLPAEGNKWIRQGEKVGHVTITEIHNGHLVYADNAGEHSIYMPREPMPMLLRTQPASEDISTEHLPDELRGIVEQLLNSGEQGDQASPGPPRPSDQIATPTPSRRPSRVSSRTSPRTSPGAVSRSAPEPPGTRRTAPATTPTPPQNIAPAKPEEMSQMIKEMIEQSQNSENPAAAQDLESLNQMLKLLESDENENQPTGRRTGPRKD